LVEVGLLIRQGRMGKEKPAVDQKGDVIQVTKDLYLGPVHVNNVEQLRRLHEAVLPVKYQDKFYNDAITYSDQGTVKLAYFKDIVVGTVCCRVDDTEDGEKMVYMMTLATLPAYRGRGIGTHLMEYITKKANEIGAKGIYLHVWTPNTEAIEFYKKNGFSIKETIKGYYKRIDPPDCHVLEKRF